MSRFSASFPRSCALLPPPPTPCATMPSSAVNQAKSPSLPTLPSASLQRPLLLSTERKLIEVRNAAITMNTPPASNPTSAPEQPRAPQPRAINFATEWLDEDGRVCPKNVDYVTQCPKGHDLVSFDCGGGAQARPASGAGVMCRVCHASTPRQHAARIACEWLVCGILLKLSTFPCVIHRAPRPILCPQSCPSGPRFGA